MTNTEQEKVIEVEGMNDSVKFLEYQRTGKIMMAQLLDEITTASENVTRAFEKSYGSPWVPRKLWNRFSKLFRHPKQ